MEKTKFDKWCQQATALIRYGPDRKAVSVELMSHLEDRRDALMEQGLDEKEATRRTLEAMGSAEEIAPQLAAVHRPFWGYVEKSPGTRPTYCALFFSSFVLSY